MNIQNFPKRINKYVRSIVIPGDNKIMASIDYGQLEARVIAVVTGDKVFCDAIKNNYDVHYEWANKIVSAYPEVVGYNSYNSVPKDAIKKFRSIVKNTFVFPLFFGSSTYSVAQSLGLPTYIAEALIKDFWSMFAGVKQYQNKMIQFYKKHGYVETLSGRRRRHTLNKNKIINTPIQGLASDIVVDSMNELCYQAYILKRPELNPILNIHDDLGFNLYKDNIKSSLRIIAKIMLKPRWGFGDVPLSVEISLGSNWCNVKEVLTLTSKDFNYN